MKRFQRGIGVGLYPSGTGPRARAPQLRVELGWLVLNQSACFVCTVFQVNRHPGNCARSLQVKKSRERRRSRTTCS